MKSATLFSIAALSTALIAGPVLAQDKAAAPPAADHKAMMDECAKEHNKMHNHAKEKGMGDGMMSKCMNEKKAAKSAAKKALHDHNKEHKAQ